MLADVALSVAAALVARSVPIEVLYGKERFTQELQTRAKVVFEESNDAFDAPRTAGANPRRVFDRTCEATAKVAASYSGVGPTVADHRRLVRRYVEQVLVALREVKLADHTLIEPSRGRFLPSDSDAEYGAQYELTFTYHEPVIDSPWPSAADDPPGFAFTDSIIINGVPYVACTMV
jgi:hypothetical protein